jgi:hypothetical protein
LTLLLVTPLGFLLSLLGVILNKGRRAGFLGLILTVVLVVFASLAYVFGAC